MNFNDDKRRPGRVEALHLRRVIRKVSGRASAPAADPRTRQLESFIRCGFSLLIDSTLSKICILKLWLEGRAKYQKC